MQQIYLDNASTTFPKPQAVADAVYQYITHAGTNISRGTCATTTEDLVFATREQLCRFFGGEDSKNVVFTKNITESLEYHHQGTAAQRRPCACYRYGAQRRHASAPANRHRAYY